MHFSSAASPTVREPITIPEADHSSCSLKSETRGPTLNPMTFNAHLGHTPMEISKLMGCLASEGSIMVASKTTAKSRKSSQDARAF